MRKKIIVNGLTYDARKSTPTGLGSCRKLRECKSVPKIVCMCEPHQIIFMKPKLKAEQLPYTMKTRTFKHMPLTEFGFSIRQRSSFPTIRRKSIAKMKVPHPRKSSCPEFKSSNYISLFRMKDPVFRSNPNIDVKDYKLI